MYRNTYTTVRRRTAHTIAAAALGAMIALAEIFVVQISLPADTVCGGNIAYAESTKTYHGHTYTYSDDYEKNLHNSSQPIRFDFCDADLDEPNYFHEYPHYYSCMQDAVNDAIRTGYSKIILQSDYAGPAPVIDIPADSSPMLCSINFDLNGHTWNVIGDKGFIVPGHRSEGYDPASGKIKYVFSSMFFTHGTLKTDSAKMLIDATDANVSVCNIETSVTDGVAVRLRGCDLSAEGSILATSGTAIEALGSHVYLGDYDHPYSISGDIAYGSYKGDTTTIENYQADHTNMVFDTDFVALDGANQSKFLISSGTFKKKIPDTWLALQGARWYYWTDNADGTTTLDYYEFDDSRIPTEDQLVVDYWTIRYGTSPDDKGYKEFPTLAEAKTEFKSLPIEDQKAYKRWITEYPEDLLSCKKHFSNIDKAKREFINEDAREATKAQKKALSRTKPGKPSAKVYRGHKVKVTFKAAKMPRGVKAKSYQVSYRQNGKTRTVTVNAKNYKTFKVTVSKLTKGKKYTFKVRAVAKIGGKNCYSGWSSYSKGIRAK